MSLGQLPNRIYSSEQIRVHPDLPNILKVYTKSVIRNQPADLFAFSMEHFRKRSDRKAAGLPADDPAEINWRSVITKPPPTGAAETDGPGLKQPVGATTLRFVMVNDVYDCDRLANFATALKAERQKADGESLIVVGVLPGDFLAPSLLSSLDKGRGMVEVLNATGLDFVCFGNHENDLPFPAMLERIRQSRFTWLNSNMPGLELGPEEREHVQHHAIINVGHSRRAALVGLVTEDPSLYPFQPFNGCQILPVNETAKKLQKELKSQADVVIPLTHQAVALDRQLAATGMFPVVLGGHDHEAYMEKTAKDSWMMKAGMDAKSIGFADVMLLDEGGWMSKAWMVSSSQFAPDPDTMQAITLHKQVLFELERAMLCRCPGTLPLSSKGSRRQQVTVGTLLMTALRNATQADIAMVNGGNIRGNVAYPLEKRTFTYADLKTEVPFPCELAVVRLPGSVIAEMVSLTRQKALTNPPVDNAAFLQLDDKAVWNGASNTLTHISGSPIDHMKLYTVALPYATTVGLDNIRPLLDYKMVNSEGFPSTSEAAAPLKHVLVSYFARAVWWEMVSSAGFAGIDVDYDGAISRAELEKACRQHHGEELGTLVVDNLMAEAHTDGSSSNSDTISPKELLRVCLGTEDMWTAGDANADGVMTLEELRSIVQQHLADGGSGALVSDEDVSEIFKAMDKDGSGGVTYGEFRTMLLGARRWGQEGNRQAVI